MADQFVTLTAQLKTNGVRSESAFGRSFLVAPVVAVKAGVLNGQLLPKEEVGVFHQAWNGRPLVLRHPVDESGEYLSANSPRVLETHLLGQLFNVEARDDSLTGEAWFDVGLAESGNDGQAIINTLKSGGVVEVSTAYWCVVEAAEGTFNGQRYNGIQRNLRPDHLAILPDEVGACSITDGCGVGRANSEKEKEMPTEKMTANEKAEQELEDVTAGEEVTANCDCEEEVTANDEAEQEVEQEAADEQPADSFAQFAAEFGGADALRDLLSGIKANAENERASLVAKVVANKSLGLSADDLKGMSDSALRKLAKVGVKANADFSGAAGAPAKKQAGGLKVYKAPALDE